MYASGFIYFLSSLWKRWNGVNASVFLCVFVCVQHRCAPYSLKHCLIWSPSRNTCRDYSRRQTVPVRYIGSAGIFCSSKFTSSGTVPKPKGNQSSMRRECALLTLNRGCTLAVAEINSSYLNFTLHYCTGLAGDIKNCRTWSKTYNEGNHTLKSAATPTVIVYYGLPFWNSFTQSCARAVIA